ncbi:MAG: SIR2 family protein [bacterium]
MNKMFIFGAGFSHDIAGLPLGKDLANIIFQKSESVVPVNRRLFKCAKAYQKVFKYLQDQAKPLMDFLKSDGTEIERLDEERDLYPIDLEYLLTLIDMNIYRPYIPKGIGVDLQQCPVPYMEGFSKFALEDSKKFILHSIAELFSPSNYKSPNYKGLIKVLGLIAPGDSILTFNYDLLLEQGLWKKGIWNPIDGYDFNKMSKYEEVQKGSIEKSKVDLIKIHGSINWINESWIENEFVDDIRINLTDPKSGINYFEGMHVKTKYPRYKKQQLYSPAIIMPTFLKHFNKSYELDLVNRAVKAIKNSSKIYVVGYSLPLADTIANFILSQIPKAIEIVIINTDDTKSIQSRLEKDYKIDCKNIKYETNSISRWIENNFELVQYQKDLEDEEFSRGLLNV